MITIKGSYVGNRQDTAEAIEFYRRGVIKAPYKMAKLSELQHVYDLMRKSLFLSISETVPLTSFRPRKDRWQICSRLQRVKSDGYGHVLED